MSMCILLKEKVIKRCKSKKRRRNKPIGKPQRSFYMIELAVPRSKCEKRKKGLMGESKTLTLISKKKEVGIQGVQTAHSSEALDGKV